MRVLSSKTRIVLIVGTISVAQLASASVVVQALADPGGYCVAHAVSEAGTYVVGYSQAPSSAALMTLWGPGGSMATYGVVNRNVIPEAISADGQRVIGELGAGGAPAFSWNPTDGIVQLPMPAQSTEAEGICVTRDGRFAVGRCRLNGFDVPTSWDQADTPTYWQPAPSNNGAKLRGGSNNLSVAVGDSYDGVAVHPTRWTQASSTGILLATLPGMTVGSATAVSSDGSVIAGYLGSSSSNAGPVWWDTAGSVHQLPVLQGTTSGGVIAMSSDGTVLCGGCTLPGDFYARPVLWINGALVSLRDLLIANGYSSSLVNTLVITSISEDGQFLSAFGGSGQNRPYLIQVPSPSWPGVLAATAFIMTRRRRLAYRDSR
jgi:uncharacterized membrane protein